MSQTTLTDDEIAALVDRWAKSTRLRVYQYLYYCGCTISGIDWNISKAKKEESV